MNNILKIIDLFGGVEDFTYVKIELGSGCMMPLTIERCGEGPYGRPAFLVQHYFIQNGDLCKDPMMVFELCEKRGRWNSKKLERSPSKLGLRPLDFEMSLPPVFTRALFKNDGKVMINARAMRELESFAKTWNSNIAAHGYVKKAREMARESK